MACDQNSKPLIGFTQEQATFLTNQQGLDSLASHGHLTDKDVDNLGQVFGKPGGTVERDVVEVQNPGFNVGHVALKSLKLMCFFTRFKERTSRPVTPADITVDNIRTMIKRAIEMDKENGDALWQDALKKEMDNVRIAFQTIEHESEIPVRSQHMDCHMVFDVKLESNFRRKCRLVASCKLKIALEAIINSPVCLPYVYLNMPG